MDGRVRSCRRSDDRLGRHRCVANGRSGCCTIHGRGPPRGSRPRHTPQDLVQGAVSSGWACRGVGRAVRCGDRRSGASAGSGHSTTRRHSGESGSLRSHTSGVHVGVRGWVRRRGVTVLADAPVVGGTPPGCGHGAVTRLDRARCLTGQGRARPPRRRARPCTATGTSARTSPSLFQRPVVAVTPSPGIVAAVTPVHGTRWDLVHVGLHGLAGPDVPMGQPPGVVRRTPPSSGLGPPAAVHITHRANVHAD